MSKIYNLFKMIFIFLKIYDSQSIIYIILYICLSAFYGKVH